MKILKNTLRAKYERWTDSGDYPSGAGSCPLPSYDYIEEIEGTITIQLEKGDRIDNSEFLNDEALVECETSVRVQEWRVVKVENDKVTLQVSEFIER